MLTPEQRQNVARWIEALTSGEYAQAKGQLRQRRGDVTAPAYCCLGVACDLHDPDKWHRLSDIYEWQANVPPEPVCKAFGLKDATGTFRIQSLPPELALELRAHGAAKLFDTHIGFLSLTELNDAGVPFAVIAKVIAARPEGLFGPFES